jgi:hypothetical protein
MAFRDLPLTLLPIGGGGGKLDRVWALAVAGSIINVMTNAAEIVNLFMVGK